LDPIPNALESLVKMQEKGHQVYICTSPLSESASCYTEKYEWVLKHLGKDWARRLIITKDKTLVYGDILIDDKPEIKGLVKPSWEHILYTQPYNQNVNHKRRLTWQEDWESILKI
jgi:5'-nucleotidase